MEMRSRNTTINNIIIIQTVQCGTGIVGAGGGCGDSRDDDDDGGGCGAGVVVVMTDNVLDARVGGRRGGWSGGGQGTFFEAS